MPNVSNTTGPQQAKSSTAKKLIQAAALASVLVPLGSVAVETASIRCVTSEAGSAAFCEDFGVYAPDGSGSNTWKFFTDSSFTTLIYAFDITGTPTSSFSLDVRDVVTTQAFLLNTGALVNFPNAVCIPTFDAEQCGLFDVFAVEGFPEWDPLVGYRATISWFANSDPLSQPDDLTKYILQAKDEFGGTIFSNMLEETSYDPAPPTFPNDPALGGRGDVFSRFGGFVEVPEPATWLLLGSGLAAAGYRRRRRKTR